jgi:hypothetical protein
MEPKVKIMTVHLGHMRNTDDHYFMEWMIPTYSKVANKIVKAVFRKRFQEEINYPLLYNLVYNYFFNLLPDIICFKMFQFFEECFYY